LDHQSFLPFIKSIHLFYSPDYSKQEFMRITAMLLISAFALIIFSASKEPVTAPEDIDSYSPAGLLRVQDTIRDRGKSIFQTQCNICHKDTINSLAPGISALNSMTPRSIVSSLESGKMRAQGAALSAVDKQVVAEWLTNTKLKNTELPKEAYIRFSLPATIRSPFNHSGWGNSAEGRGFRTAEQAGITENSVQNLTLKWALAFPEVNIMRAKPAVVENWLIFGTQFGDVYAVERNTGAIGWNFKSYPGSHHRKLPG
jgi:polyvinyl alcohol dehydrogenase (cytochrome)